MQLQSKDKRALLILAGAVLLFALLQTDLFLPRPSGATAGTGSIEAAEQAFRLAQAKARKMPLIDAEADAVRRRLEQIEKGLLTSETAALAKAEMRQIVEELLTSEGIAMNGSRFGNAELEGESYVQVPVVVDFDCQIEQFVNWMSAVANASQLLSTRRIQIAPGNKETKAVRVQVTVSGYLPASRAPELTKSTRLAGARL